MISLAQPMLGERERERVISILDSGHLVDGPEVRDFEAEFARYCGTSNAVATSNGTTALHAALVALGLGPGDRILTTPFSFIATANAARFVGSDIGFVDIDRRTYCLDTDHLEEQLREGRMVDAVIAVHLFGLPAALDRLQELAETYSFYLIEDAAQAHGATYADGRVGSFGDVGCFSFYPTKNMTTGEGGMITTDRPEVAERAARFIDHGREEGYRHVEVGHNFRMTSIAAAIGRVQLERLPAFIEARRKHASRYDEAFERTPIQTPHVPSRRTHVYNQYTITHPDRDGLRARLAELGIQTGVYYPTPIHRQPAYAGHEGRAPVAEQVAKHVLSLPVHPALPNEAVDTIIDGVTSYAEVVT